MRMKEIKFHGRGGQGVVKASQILGLAYFKAGMYPQCYSLFGGERRGAPVVSFLRVDRERILLKCDIKHPEELLIFDASLMDPGEIQDLMVPGSSILLNIAGPSMSLSGLGRYRLGLVDATGIAQNLGLGHVINAAMLGAYCRLTEHLPLIRVLEAIGEMIPASREENAQAVRSGYETLTVLDREG